MTTRYVITTKRPGATRTLAEAMQGRYTYSTPEEAAWRAKAITSNTPELYPDLEIRPVECHDGHFDPKTCWFED
jgi:hypothetical protein